MSGVWLARTAPQIAAIDCGDCQKWLYDFTTGRRQLRGSSGRGIRRQPGTAPCRMPHQGCLKGTPENSKALTPENQEAYDHYRECKAVSEFPRDGDGQIDAIVKRNAGLIRAVEERAEEIAADRRARELQDVLVKIVTEVIKRS